MRALRGYPRNMLQYTETFSNALWLVAAGASKGSPGAYTAPYGGSTDPMPLTLGSAAGSLMYQNVTLIANALHTLSVWARTATGTGSVRLGAYSGSGGSALSPNGGTSGNLALTTAWQQIYFTFQTGAVIGAASNIVLPYNNSAGGAQTIVLWGASLTLGQFVPRYAPVNT